MNDLQNRLEGAILGTAVGDAIGLAREGLSARRARRIFGPPPLEYALLPRIGMVSDDTEHTCMATQALLRGGAQPERFAQAMAWELRFWFASIPAGVGWATLRSCLRLWAGFPPGLSGVRSAGNGPAMRSAVLGVFLRDDPESLRHLVRACTRMTHTDERAFQGALAIATAASLAARQATPDQCLEGILEVISGDELRGHLQMCRDLLARGASPEAYADAMGCAKGVGGYINHTVPVAIYCWLRHPRDFRLAVESAVCLGGDSDTVGAITGALAGTSLGTQAIPPTWMAGLKDWPWNVARMRELARRLAEKSSPLPIRRLFPLVLLRNLLFAAIVITHGLRRLFPPY